MARRAAGGSKDAVSLAASSGTCSGTATKARGMGKDGASFKGHGKDGGNSKGYFTDGYAGKGYGKAKGSHAKEKHAKGVLLG